MNFGTPNYSVNNSCLVLDSRFIWATNRVRFTVTAEGLTKTFTQTGDLLLPPVLKATRDTVNVQFTRGSELLVECSTDTLNWKSFYTLPWSSATNFVSIQVPQGDKMYIRSLSR